MNRLLNERRSCTVRRLKPKLRKRFPDRWPGGRMPDPALKNAKEAVLQSLSLQNRLFLLPRR